MSNPNDWIFQPYQNDFSHINHIETSPPNNAFSAAAAAAAAAAAEASRSNKLSPDQGRVAKPIRRRSRASRRTPTTLLNTDTANFRAMVQHFTGGPAAAAARQQIPDRAAALSYMAAAPAVGGFHVQYPNQMFAMENVHGGGEAPAPPQAAAGSGNRVNYGGFMI